MTTALERDGRQRADLPERLDALAHLVSLGEGKVDEELLRDARALLATAGQRLRLSGEHTVVAFVGATGSGKSSLFNAVVGLELSPIGVRRPTTQATHACFWGIEGAPPLLNWLGVQGRHRFTRASTLDRDATSSLRGLVLLDLPDHDSLELGHRREAERIVEVADLIVWVVDPQKYADAAVHERYLRPLAHRGAVTVVVLNQADRLRPEEAEECTADLRRLLEADGLSEGRVLVTSAREGTGVDALRALLAEAVARRHAAADRITADVDRLVARFAAYGNAEVEAPVLDPTGRSAVTAGLAEAAGVSTVAWTMGNTYRHRSRRYVGWLFARAVRGLRGDPFRRVRLGPETRDGLRTTLPGPASAQQVVVDRVLLDVNGALRGTLPGPWREAVRRAGRSRGEDVPRTLEKALAEVQPDGPPVPLWWWLAGALQWLLALGALTGLAWATALICYAFLGLGVAPMGLLGDARLLPYPIAATAGALALGTLCEAGAVRLVDASASRHRQRVEAQMTERVGAVAEETVFASVAEELEGYARFCRALEVARGTSAP